MTMEEANKGTEQSTEQVLDILGAGEAFKAMFENTDNLPADEQGKEDAPPAESQDADGDAIDIPVDESQPQDQPKPQPQFNPESLDTLKEDIIGELRSLMESTKKEDTPPGEKQAEEELASEAIEMAKVAAAHDLISAGFNMQQAVALVEGSAANLGL